MTLCDASPLIALINEGEQTLCLDDEKIEVCNAMYDTDPQIIVSKVIKIYYVKADIRSS